MTTFYVTSPYWEKDYSDLLDLRGKSEKELYELLANNPNGLFKVVPHGEDSAFKKIFMKLDENGFPVEGVFKTILNKVEIEYRIVENINIKRYRSHER